MKITKQELIDLKVCRGGLNRFIAQTNNTDEPVEVSSLVGGENTCGDLIWLADKKLSKERIVRFVCDCVLLNVELIKPYTDDYDTIVEFLHNPTCGIARARDAAWAAAETAANVIDPHYEAVYAARAAAETAANVIDPHYEAVYAARAASAAHSATYTTAAATADVYYATAVAYAVDEDGVNKLLRELFA